MKGKRKWQILQLLTAYLFQKFGVKKLNQLLEKNCVMMQCVNRNWEGEIKQQFIGVKE
jgi:hypothetical protein